MAHAHDIRSRAHDARMNRPLVGRRFSAAKIVAVEVKQNQFVEGRAAGADLGDGEKCRNEWWSFVVRDSNERYTKKEKSMNRF